MTLIFGYDTGAASLGFIPIRHQEESGEGGFLNGAVNIFQEGADVDGKTPNQNRRLKKHMRVQYRRRRQRRDQLLNALFSADLLPAARPKDWPKALQNGKDGELPYHLRRAALTDKLSLHEIGRSLYHLFQRRGYFNQYQGFEDTAAEPDEETGKVAVEISAIRNNLAGRTLGGFLAAQPARERKRNRHFAREMIEAEFDAIFQAQQVHYPAVLTNSLREHLKAIGFHQRPVFWRLGGIGRCRYLPHETPAMACSWNSEMLQLLDRINNLRIRDDNNRRLSPEERSIALDMLIGRQKLPISSLRKAFAPLWKKQGLPARMQFNVEVKGGSKDLPGHRLEAQLRHHLGQDWQIRMQAVAPAIQQQVAPRLLALRTERHPSQIVLRSAAAVAAARPDFLSQLEQDWGLSESEAQCIAEIKLRDGFLDISDAAIEKLLPPMLERGLNRAEAAALVFAPLMEKPRDADPDGALQAILAAVTSPIARRSLRGLLRTHRAAIKQYGQPDVVRIELARDVQLSGERRQKYLKQLSQNEKERRKAVEALEQLGFAPHPGNIEKYRLWREAGESCIYTLRKIPAGELFAGDAYWQVDHIVPRGLRIDNAVGNKMLIPADINRLKGKRTPFQFLTSSDPQRPELKAYELKDWKEFKRVFARAGFSKRLPKGKVAAILSEEDPDTEGFLDRQMAEAGQVARVAVELLKCLSPQATIEVVNGRIVATLRKLYGLNALLSDGAHKNREDNRHHLVDAVAVALASRRHVHRIANFLRQNAWVDDHVEDAERRKAWRQRRREVIRENLPLPWPKFLDECDAMLDRVVVAYRPRRKVAGALHEETQYGAGPEMPEQEGKRKFSNRVSVIVLKSTDVSRVRNEGARRALQGFFEQIDAQAWDKLSKPEDMKKRAEILAQHPLYHDTDRATPIRKVQLWEIRSADTMVMINPATRAYADRGSNHHMAIYRRADGGLFQYVVSRFEAMQRMAANRRSRRAEMAPDAELYQRRRNDGILVQTIAVGDMFRICQDEKFAFVRIGSIKKSGQIRWVDCNVAREPKSEAGRTAQFTDFMVKLQARRVIMSPIGQVTYANR